MVAIFPPLMVGVDFERCNLDNVLVAPGNTVDARSQHRLIKVQNDLEDWEIDKTTKEPIEPLNKEEFIVLGISTDPKDIQLTIKTKSVTEEKREE